MAESKNFTGILEGPSPAEDFDQPESDREIITDINEKVAVARRQRLGLEHQWDLNLNFLRGNQVLLRRRGTNQIFRLPKDDTSRLISQYNILRPIARSLLGKMTRAIPTAVALPPSDDVADMQGAMVADSLLRYQRYINNLDIVYTDWSKDVIDYGTGFVRVRWDSEAGHKVLRCNVCSFSTPYHPDKEGIECPSCLIQSDLSQLVQPQSINEEIPPIDGQGNLNAEESTVEQIPGLEPENPELVRSFNATEQSLGELESGVPELVQAEGMEIQVAEIGTLVADKLGEVVVETADPRFVLLDPFATDIRMARWFAIRAPVPLQTVRTMFPNRGKYVHEQNGIWHESMPHILTSLSNLTQERRILEDSVFMTEYHEIPSKKYPRGRLIYEANGVLLNPSPKDQENPYIDLFGRLPLFVGYWERNQEEFWGESFIDQAWMQQRELNILLTQMREHRELTNRPRLLLPNGCGINVDEVTTVAGQVFNYNAMVGSPRFMETPPLPPYVPGEVERLKGDIATQASVTGQETGQVEARISGRYAAIVEAEASQQLGPMLRRNNKEWSDVHKCILMLCQIYYDDERRWTIEGADRPHTYYFKDLNLFGVDIQLEQEDSLSQNPAIRQEQVMEWAKIGLFTDQDTGKLRIKSLARTARIKLPFIGPDEESSERSRAAAVPNQIENGEIYQPKPWDDARIFSEELLGWLRGPGQNKPDPIKMAVFEIWQQYSALLIENQRQKAMRQMGPNPPQGQPQPLRPQGDAQSAGKVLNDMAQMVGAADKAAESVAKAGPHEG